MKALLLIDIQNDFLSGGALAVPKGNEIIPTANRLLGLKGSFFDRVVASRDWHPADHQSFASQHPGRKAGELIDWHGLSQVLWPDHCVQHSRGSEFHKELNTSALDHIVLKGLDREIDSYSAFFDNGYRKATDLGPFLVDQRISEIYLAGLATDYCVKFTALDAVSAKFKTYLIEDGCRGVNLKPDDSERARSELRNAGVEMIHSRELF
jgi:nicotinamidase/pyrazinamidase